MQPLRNARRLARFVLAWFALTICVAVAAPLVQPQSFDLVCSGGVMKLVVKGNDSLEPAAGVALDCPLCSHAGAPPPAQPMIALPGHRLAYALRNIPAAHIAWLTRAPLPARGPPGLS